VQALRHTSTVHDDLVWIGQGADRQQVRRISVLYQGKWYRYLTNELAPARVPVLSAVALYYQRWRIEDAYNAVKRLLGLAYFWVGSENGVQLQLWATWILYAVIVKQKPGQVIVRNRPPAWPARRPTEGAARGPLARRWFLPGPA